MCKPSEGDIRIELAAGLETVELRSSSLLGAAAEVNAYYCATKTAFSPNCNDNATINQVSKPPRVDARHSAAAANRPLHSAWLTLFIYFIYNTYCIVYIYKIYKVFFCHTFFPWPHSRYTIPSSFIIITFSREHKIYYIFIGIYIIIIIIHDSISETVQRLSRTPTIAMVIIILYKLKFALPQNNRFFTGTCQIRRVSCRNVYSLCCYRREGGPRSHALLQDSAVTSIPLYCTNTATYTCSYHRRHKCIFFQTMRARII